jgi:hypothetical protein
MGKKLLAVVGAGASSELGLPIGSQLKANISRLLRIEFDDWGSKLERGDRTICDALRSHATEIYNGQRVINPFLPDLHHISDAMPQAISIDHFINDQRRRGNIEVCGKLGISRAILLAEKSSSLYLKNERRDERIDFSRTETSWLNPFARIITQSCTSDELAERFSQIGLVVFNYDRCVEHFLYYWLQSYYKMSSEKAGELVQRIEIYHPYGKVGPLPWQDHQQGVSYGCDPHPDQLLNLAKQIKTFTEGTDPDSSDICGIRELMTRAERVVFLGFAYHTLNLDLLRSNVRSNASERAIYGTALGVSDIDLRIIQAELAHMFNCGSDFVHLRSNLACSKIFSEFNRGLSVR